MGAIAVSAYSYMALVPLIQRPVMLLLTTKKERLIRMPSPRRVQQKEKILFPIIGFLLTAFIVPSALPLLGMLFFGNLLKERAPPSRCNLCPLWLIYDPRQLDRQRFHLLKFY